MPENVKKRKRPSLGQMSASALPAWYAWTAVAAMFLIAFPVFSRALGGDWLASHLSLGEWLLLPLGVLSLTLGLVTLSKVPERTLLPLWLAAMAPGVLWLLAECLSMFKNGMGRNGGDLLLAWTVRLLFPAIAFLPLLVQETWRDRLFWALCAGMAANVAAIIIQLASGETGRIGALEFTMSGFFDNQHDYGLFLAIGLPLIAGWRGGGVKRRPALAMVFCMFLLPAVALNVLFTGGLLLAATAGLTAAWAAWRSHAWLLGVFLCLLILGYGSEAKRTRERDQRVLLASTLSPVNPAGGLSLRLAGFDAALAVFIERPYLGLGPDAFFSTYGKDPNQTGADLDAPSWYAQILGASGLVGLCMWFVLMGEIFARAVGRRGRNCIVAGGVLGAGVGLAAAGVWTNVLASGPGALVGFILALSIIEDSGGEAQEKPRRRLASDSIMMRRTRIMERVSGKKSKDKEPEPQEKSAAE